MSEAELGSRGRSEVVLSVACYKGFGYRSSQPTVPRFMNVSGNNSQLQQLQFAVAVEKKAQATVREQGQQAVQLIEAASPQPAPASNGTGARLNVVA